MSAQQIKITKPMLGAALAVVMCKAAVETIEPIVLGYQQKILDYEQYDVDKKWVERGMFDANDWIKSPKDTYKMDNTEFKHYIKRCREEQAKSGLKTKSPDHCPLLVAEHQLVRAKRLLVDIMEPITRISYKDVYRPKDRDELVELTLRLICSTKEFNVFKNRVVK